MQRPPKTTVLARRVLLYDCEGNCLNDTDGDGICEEVPGCTDDTACNYDPVATEDDMSCTYAEQYLDCDGNCLMDTDGDGVCDESGSARLLG